MVLAKDIPDILKKHFQIDRLKENSVELSGIINNRRFTSMWGGVRSFYLERATYYLPELHHYHQLTINIL